MDTKGAVASMEKPLAGRRILVPPARPEANPLLHILERKGAEVLEFPSLMVAPPSDYAPMDEAIQHLGELDWIVFSGSNCVINFFERLNQLGLRKADPIGPKIVAIGHGASAALKQRGIKVDYVPARHVAEDVIAGLEDVYDRRFLLVRVEGASPSLPERLKSVGAHVKEVAGYRMLIEAIAKTAKKVFGQNLDALALANPSSLRFLIKGSGQAGLNLMESLKGVMIAAVGPATAEAARNRGLAPDIISKGHIADLAESLIDFFKK
jgi:uroporphyrinogen III methyltransferase/synthase